MSSTRRDPLIGDLVDGRYEVLDRVARGGMSTVYRALDHRLDREVALKVMHPHLAEDPALVGRFEREAKTAARISHPHVVAVLDQGHTADEAGDVLAYLVMEHVPGRTLRAVIREEAPVAPRRAVALLEPVVEGLAAAHRAGLVHRDVKPENVLVRTDGRITVADFGLSRAATGHTSAGQTVFGTPAYLAPELISGTGGDARADVYGVGIMLFELLTGTQPFTAATPLQVAYRHVHERVPVPSSVRPGLPEALDDIVLWCTEPRPADRPDDAAALLPELRRVAALLPETAPADEAPAADDAPTVALAVSPTVPTVPVPDAADATARLEPRRPDPRRAEPVPTPATATAASPSSDLSSAVPEAPRPAPVAPRPASARQRRRAARTPEVVLGAGMGRTVAVGAAVTLLLAGMALLLGWILGSGGISGPAGVVVPPLRGLEQQEAAARLAEAGLTSAVVSRHDERFSDGVVLDVSPAAGSTVDAGGPVRLTVSDGPAPVPAPDLAGLTVTDAHAAAEDGRVGVVVADRVADRAVPAGAVVSQSPEAGAEMTPGDEVAVVLSTGPATHPLPDLGGLTVGEARTRLADLGFVPDVRTLPLPGPSGDAARVLRQGTPAGTVLPEGASVQLWTL